MADGPLMSWLRRYFTRQELTPTQRLRHSLMQTCVGLGMLLVTRGLTSSTHWAFNPDAPYQVSAFAPLSPAVALAAVPAGLALLIAAAVLADRAAARKRSET